MNNLNPSQKTAEPPRSGCLLALILLTGLPALVAPLRADNPPAFLFQWGSYGTASGQFSFPGGIALDSSNNVYVSDSGNDRIEKFDTNGNYLTQWGGVGGGNGQFAGSMGIAVDSSDHVYVVDYGNNRIEKFDANGNYLTQWGSYGTGNGQFGDYAEGFIVGIAADSSNNVYVVDTGNGRIEKFDSNGNYLTQWGSYGGGNGQFYIPEGIAVDSNNNVYVADAYNNRIEKFDSNGNYLTQWGSYGGGNGQFSNPVGVTVDSSNNVYAVDSDNDRIEKFDSNGNYLTQWGGAGGGNGQFSYAVGIATTANGNTIYVVDQNNCLIEVFVYNTNIPPIIATQPASRDIIAGYNASFSVTAAGAAPFAYQWTSNNVALPDATNSTLTVTNVIPADEASYAVMVTNNFGGALSSNAVLTVLPAVVTTLAASRITTTNAVLSGSVTTGSEEALAWFDWGTNTSYGNFAGITTIPGDVESALLTNVLSGLDGNQVYHYRIVAANDSGIVYGTDSQFQPGFRPVVANDYASNQTNSAILNALVNPEGRNTTVFFTWDFTNSTPPVAIGSGSIPVTVSAPITGLTPGATYDFFGFASNSAGVTSLALVTFQAIPWSPNASPYLNWQSIASSADGSKLTAAPYGGNIFTSTNSGTTWLTNNSLSANWISIASSADGSKLAAAIGGFFNYQSPGRIYLSTNSGATWTLATNMPVRRWTSLTSSADGARLAAVAQPYNGTGGGIYTSTNSGGTWTSNNAPATNWICIASSADGSHLVAAVNGGLIYTSTNAGGAWTNNNNAPATNWQTVASSADGNKLAAASGGYSPAIEAGPPGPVYTSTNAGATWTQQTNAPVKDWFSVASSADGCKLVAVAFSNPIPGVTNSIFTSTDAGVTWANSEAPGTAWEFAASSADGSKLAALANSAFSGTGLIYTFQTTPTPFLNLAAAANTPLISWIVPSLDFTLQQSPDLSNWTDMTNVPILNFSNLENQVVLPAPVGNSFFRLKH